MVGEVAGEPDSFGDANISFHLPRAMLYRPATSDISSAGSAGCCVLFVCWDSVGAVTNFVFFSVSFL